MPALEHPASPSVRPGSVPAIFLPGIIMPASLRYAPLLDALGDTLQPVVKELEVYAADAPPDDYGIAHEIAGIDRVAADAGFDRFHLYGHSAGGAIAIAYVAVNPDRVLGLALDEPASDFSPEAHALNRQDTERLAALPPEERNRAFTVMQLAPGVEPPAPPPGPPPDWMAKRPAGVETFMAALLSYDVSPDDLRRFDGPVYYSHGSLSDARWTAMRDRLAAAFPNFTSEEYEGLHHFQTSHAKEPERVAKVLREMWLESN
jgi:pimeloyl-ACP methyl ester carboxylesterase